MTVSTLPDPTSAFATVVADTNAWLAEQLVAYEARGMSRPGSADRFRQRAQRRDLVVPGFRPVR